jgi:hypothetical protein
MYPRYSIYKKCIGRLCGTILEPPITWKLHCHQAQKKPNPKSNIKKAGILLKWAGFPTLQKERTGAQGTG